MENTRLRRANARKQIVELRRPNLGKEITDGLPTVHIDPDTLDLYSEVQPVDELVSAMRDKWMLVQKVEIPKWQKRHRRGALRELPGSNGIRDRLHRGENGNPGRRDRQAAERAYNQAGLGPSDMDIYEVYGSYPGVNLIVMDALGICEPGRSGELVEAGETSPGGKYPCSTNGEALGMGHTGTGCGLPSSWRVCASSRARQARRRCPMRGSRSRIAGAEPLWTVTSRSWEMKSLEAAKPPGERRKGQGESKGIVPLRMREERDEYR